MSTLTFLIETLLDDEMRAMLNTTNKPIQGETKKNKPKQAEIRRNKPKQGKTNQNLNQTIYFHLYSKCIKPNSQSNFLIETVPKKRILMLKLKGNEEGP